MTDDVIKNNIASEKVDVGGFLQSQEWMKFQESVGRKTFEINSEDQSVLAVEHELPMVGKYFYTPRWPKSAISNQQSAINERIKLIKFAKERNAGWIRIEPENEKILEIIKNTVEIDGNKLKIAKAPHDMQPRENFVIDISKNEEELLKEMKSKTKYNLKLAQRKAVRVFAITNDQDARNKQTSNYSEQKTKECYTNEFLRLTKEMSLRQGIKAHPEEYYRKMVESLPEDMLRLYIAEYDNKIIAANLVLYYGNTATYLHGASGNEYRNLMAPYLLQWQAILDAKEAGYKFYDFGGVSMNHEPQTKNWEGITKFKQGFSPNTEPVVFPGSYDIVIDRWKYFVYRTLQRIKALIYKFSKQF